MTVIRFIGDIHGKWNEYVSLLDCERSVQVGDFGMGFANHDSDMADAMFDIFPGEHRFIRGNHDSPDECRKSTHWIDDGTIEDGIMYIGGASSIDRAWRTAGVDWWHDEELSYEELYQVAEVYAQAKPNILVTHECPEFWATVAMIPLVRGNTNFPSRTRVVLDEMYAAHRPKLHIFGHWHHNLNYVDKGTGTHFVCLNELAFIDINTEMFK